jgi:hypothetical protein
MVNNPNTYVTICIIYECVCVCVIKTQFFYFYLLCQKSAFYCLRSSSSGHKLHYRWNYAHIHTAISPLPLTLYNIFPVVMYAYDTFANAVAIRTKYNRNTRVYGFQNCSRFHSVCSLITVLTCFLKIYVCTYKETFVSFILSSPRCIL